MTEESQSTFQEPLEAPRPRKALSVFAIISVIAGIGTYVWFFAMIGSKTILTLILTPLIALVAIITGHKARRDIRKSLADMKGKTLANAGLGLGYFIILIGLFIVILAVMGVLSAITALFGG